MGGVGPKTDIEKVNRRFIRAKIGGLCFNASMAGKVNRFRHPTIEDPHVFARTARQQAIVIHFRMCKPRLCIRITPSSRRGQTAARQEYRTRTVLIDIHPDGRFIVNNDGICDLNPLCSCKTSTEKSCV